MSLITNLLGMVLKFIYQTLSGFGGEPQNVSYYALALMVMAVFVKIITLPLTLKATKNAQRGQELNPKTEAIRKKYANDPNQMNQKIMELYKEHNYNPASGCLPMLIPLIIIFALIGVIRDPAKYMLDSASQIHEIARNFFWIPDLVKSDPYMYGLPLIYAVSMIAYSSMVQTPATDQRTAQMNNMMKYMMPVMMFFMSKSWPSGLILFWATSNIVEILIRFLMKLTMKTRGDANWNL